MGPDQRCEHARRRRSRARRGRSARAGRSRWSSRSTRSGPHRRIGHERVGAEGDRSSGCGRRGSRRKPSSSAPTAIAAPTRIESRRSSSVSSTVRARPASGPTTGRPRQWAPAQERTPDHGTEPGDGVRRHAQPGRQVGRADRRQQIGPGADRARRRSRRSSTARESPAPRTLTVTTPPTTNRPEGDGQRLAREQGEADGDHERGAPPSVRRARPVRRTTSRR